MSTNEGLPRHDLDTKVSTQRLQVNSLNEGSSEPLIASRGESLKREMTSTIKQFQIISIVAYVLLVAALVLNLIWLHYLSDFTVRTSRRCAAVDQFILHLKVVNILTILGFALNFAAIVLRKRLLIFIIIAVVFFILCYRVVLVIVWYVAQGDSIVKCLVKSDDDDSLSSQERFGFYLSFCLIFHDLIFEAANAYFVRQIKKIQEHEIAKNKYLASLDPENKSFSETSSQA